jgi:superfamily II DNA or RNA helicase
MSFQDLEILSSYDSGFAAVDVVKNFYVPVLESSVKYDRVAGYFSSRVFASAARGIAGLVRNGGKMRLVTSHAFTPKDTEVFKNYYETDEFAESLAKEFSDSFLELKSLANSIATSHVAAMCWMLSKGYLEIRVVVPDSADLISLTPQEIDKFHPKFGVLYDSNGNKVAFSGSVNETEGAWRRNIENFDVFQSWIPGRDDYINPKIDTFEKYWNGNLDGKWRTIDLPEAVREKIIRDFAPEEFPEKEIQVHVQKYPGLRYYQEDAVEAWINAGRTGLLEMATGTGKTRTAGFCITESGKLGKLLTVIVVPYQHIGVQWSTELKSLSPIFASGTNWKRKLAQIETELNLDRRSELTLIVVKNTASKSEFTAYIDQIRSNFDNFLLVADEVHWLGARAFQPALLESANFRLGLSATPQRYFDEEGTDVIVNYFNSTVYSLTIEDALKIRDEGGNPILTPYEYHPIVVGLDEEELVKYREFSKKIAALKNQDDAHIYEAQLQNLYIQRSNVIKSASQKISALRDLLENFPRPLTQCLIYCADFKQLDQVASILSSLGIHTQKITGDENAHASTAFAGIAERTHIINNFAEGHLNVLLAIDCLDEGVDIPSAQIGIILASSGNPKEFIQRRGRLMRPFNGKTMAEIYDFCVLPRDIDDPVSTIAAVGVELKRILEFGSIALNAHEIEDFVATLLPVPAGDVK